MKQVTIKKITQCEVCGFQMEPGEAASVRYDYDWDNPNEDEQGSIAVPFYRHADRETCQKNVEVNRAAAKIQATFEEDDFRKANL